MFDLLIPIALGATILVLLIGVFVMARGGELNRKYGNKLMRLRIVAQVTVVALFLLAIWFGNQSG